MRVGLVALAVTALCASARADGRDAGVVVQADAKVERAVVKALDAAGFRAVHEPLSRDGLDTLANCSILEDLACARGVVEARSKTPRLVLVRTEDGAFTVTWFSAGHEPLVEKTTCAECVIEKLASRAPEPVVRDAVVGRPHKRSRLVPSLLVGAGPATPVTGGGFLYYRVPAGASHKYVYPQLTPVGITLLAVGGGAMIGGIFTW